jgi:predicted DNA-binding protein
MQAKKRAKRLNSVVAIRLSSEQAFRLSERARQTGQTASEWGRQTILQSLDASLDTRLILAETLALRKIVLALQLDLLQGQAVTEQRLRSIIENAESTKFVMTENRIHSARSYNSND